MRIHWSFPATLAVITLGALAQESSYDFVACTHNKLNMLESTPEITVYGSETWGMVANSSTPEWENASTRCVGVTRVAAGKSPVGRGSCKWILASGDTAIGEYEYGLGPAKFTWLAGTGRLKGIEGAGTFQPLNNPSPAAPGTAQGCRRDWGKYRLPIG